MLFLYLTAFAVKYYLNGAEEAELVGVAASETVRHLSEVFEEWSETSAAELLTIQPKRLNDSFKFLVRKDSGTSQQIDYNSMV